MLKGFALLITAFCGLVHAVSQQVHYKTPLGVDYQGSPLSVSRKILSTKKVPFVEHSAGDSSWLGMAIDYQYIKPIFNELNSTQVPLISRGESHITVISPPEFVVLSTANVTIDEINKIAIKHSIQSSKIKIVCLGKEDVVLKDERYVVYQIIVKSSDLVKIRQEIFKLYVKNGGNTALFDPNVTHQ
ncbi:hypothetical protein G6F37_008048 [Rhizopus arrhizus]|nr:hypothetical protein G6F38_007190 [Rhizopus arrhizus]KAG1155962.1 hypothetical protein G6F37_008048 [Rhizopus arrhizus]